MSVTWRGLVVLAALLAASPAWAQEEDDERIAVPGSDRFFADKVDTEEDDEDKTLVQGNLTSTNLFHRETAGVAQPLPGGQVGAENASPINRLFTDLRARLDARHISGSDFDAALDARVRMAGDGRFQSGTLAGDEYEVRDAYVVRRGGAFDAFIGRQHVLELAAVKIDGIRVNYQQSGEWSYLGFAGAYPSRVSRSIETDYPVIEPVEGEQQRVIPIAAGGGAAYRYGTLYGAFGLVGILPRATELANGATEQPRIFATSNGYWRRSPKLDVYHYAVVDLQGSAGAGLTNLSLGTNFRPRPNMRVNAAINRVDTETLNVVAQTQLEDPNPGAGFVQNNIEVMRIASESARVGLSVALMENRFEVFTNGQLRRRPEIQLRSGENLEETIIIPAAQAADITFGVVDRRFYQGIRLNGTYTRTFGFGESNLNRATADVVRVAGNRSVMEGKGEVEGELTYLSSRDENRGETCIVGQLLTCYGTSAVRTISAGAIFFYRFKADWFLVGSGNLGVQKLTTATMDTETAQPSILLTTFLARIAYRF